jgi:hypothetical protein
MTPSNPNPGATNGGPDRAHHAITASRNPPEEPRRHSRHLRQNPE